MADLAKYVVSLEAETAKYQRNLEKANRQLSRFNKSQSRTLDAIKASFTRLASVGAVALTGIVAASVATAKGLDRVAKAAKDAQVGVETFQAWEFAATQSGVSITEFSAAMGRAQRRVGLFASDGTGPAAKSFERLGINVRDTSGAIRSQESIIREYVRKLGDLGSAQERTAEITALFGDDARRLALVFGQGIDALERFEEQARQLGIVIDGQTLKAAEDFNDQMDILRRILQAGLAKNLQAISEVILSIGNAAIKALPHIREFFAFLTNSQRFQLTQQASDLTERIRNLQKEIEQTSQFTQGIFGEQAEREVAEKNAELQKLLSERERIFSEIAALERGPSSGGGTTPLLSSGGGGAPIPFYEQAKKEAEETAKTIRNAFDQVFTETSDAENTAGIFKAFDKMAEMAEDQKKKQQEMKDGFITLFTDNMVQAAESGFDAVLESWARTLQQMAARAIASKLFDLLSGGQGGGVFGVISNVFGGQRAAGGPVNSGQAFLVGERGPELFVPPSAGNIVPNHSLGGLNITVNAPNADIGVIPMIEQGVQKAVRIARSERIEDRKRGR